MTNKTKRTYKYSKTEGRWFYVDQDSKYTNYYQQAFPSDNTEEGKFKGYYGSTNKDAFDKA